MQTALTIETEETGAFLGVQESASGKKWVRSSVDSRAAEAMMQTLGVPLIVAELLIARGQTIQNAPLFLNPKLKESLPDPLKLKDMAVAADRFIAAVKNKEKVVVFGDYDVDGGTSSALLARFAQAVGCNLQIYIPDRMAEGYGPNSTAMQRFKDEGASLVITVDCGTTAHEPLTHAKAIGLDVIVLDHHTAEPNLPPAVAIVNANRLDDAMQSEVGHCAAVGIVFLFVIAANRLLREQGFYQGKAEPDLMSWLDLVALGTVADVVPLTTLNRAYVCQGLKVMQKRQNRGLVALADVARLTKAPDAFSLGFVFGPRVNAGGRVGQSDLGATLLSTDSDAQAHEIARTLEAYNVARKELEGEIQLQANEQLEGTNSHLALAVGEGWHPGVIGIVAARLKERFHRPSFVIAVNDKGIGKGSGRSIRGIDLGALTIAARQAGLLINGGGHAMAAGLTVAAEKIPELRTFFEERLDALITPEILQPKIVVDGLLTLSAATADFMDQLDQFAPFGSGNAEPRFAIANVRITAPAIVGADHIRCILCDDQQRRLKAITFRCVGTPLGDALLHSKGPVKVVGKLSRDDWNGRNDVQFQLEDIAA